MPTPEFKSEFFEKYGVSPEDADINTFASIFDEAYGVKLDGANIKTAVSNILINNSSPEEREQKLKKDYQQE